MSGGVSGGSQKGTPQLTPQQLIDTYNQNLPQMLGTTVGQATPTATLLAGAASAANPIYTASGLQQLNQYAPGYQQAGANLATQQAQSTADLINGAGGNAATAATNLSNRLNPVQAAEQTQAQNLLSSINLNGLSPGETNAVQRSLNQSNYSTGNLGLSNATNDVSNAMNFGNALAAKQSTLSSALGAAGGVASNQNSFVNPVGTATSAGNTSTNFGLGTFAPTQANSTVTAPLTFGSSIFSPTASNASASNTKGSQSSVSGGICCFIFMEAYNGQLPENVRKCRDLYYEMYPQVANGYVKMSRWLVPSMKRVSAVRWIVNKFMVIPLTKFGNYVQVCDSGEGRRYKIYQKFWFIVWNFLGKD
jgi:hypothetical protein